MQNAYRRWARNARKSIGLGDSRLRRETHKIRGLGVPIRARVRANEQNAKMWSHKNTYIDDILVSQFCAICCAKKLRYEQK